MNINKMLNTYGSSVYISGVDGWKSPIFKAFLQPLRYKNKLYQQGSYTPLGINKNNVYLYNKKRTSYEILFMFILIIITSLYLTKLLFYEL